MEIEIVFENRMGLEKIYLLIHAAACKGITSEGGKHLRQLWELSCDDGRKARGNAGARLGLGSFLVCVGAGCVCRLGCSDCLTGASGKLLGVGGQRLAWG